MMRDVESTARVDEVLALVRSSGGRATSARRAILQTLFEDSHEHPTAEQITSSVQRDQPDVAESTVYRFLDELEKLGVVNPVRLGHGPAVYHLAEHTHHHHLVCSRCGRMVEVSDEIFDSLRRSLRRDHSFEIEPRHFTLAGHCTSCTDP
jgi:Fur family transcriptional regulator, ferric uptake regulator